MHLETAIRDAVEKGGFKNEVIEGIRNFHGGTEAYTFGRLNTSAILLDAAFWRALGNARGWRHYTSNAKLTSHKNCSKMCDWIGQWHRLIDHLAAGSDAESFLRTLREGITGNEDVK